MVATFIAGFMLGGLIVGMLVRADLKGRYETEKVEEYNRGYKNGREVEQRAIFDYIDLLNRDANASTYNDELSRGSDN